MKAYKPDWNELHRYNEKLRRRLERHRHREWHDEKAFNDRCEKWWSGGLLLTLLDLLRRR